MKDRAGLSAGLPANTTYCVALYRGDVPDESQLLACSTNPSIISSVAQEMTTRYREQRAMAAESRAQTLIVRGKAVEMRERCILKGSAS